VGKVITRANQKNIKMESGEISEYYELHPESGEKSIIADLFFRSTKYSIKTNNGK
jgi:hypothetical protein